ncbi:unnamed protein product [Prorocentrum cordatum]|uniref:FAD dependent oxidoreductase domain-containing protein n=1 Tax=Prorocentrum cordatum TaxID=2364126 RepID=A0ABN9WEX9_9DINO|nr:unnamed protein product [Polarella glacialis]
MEMLRRTASRARSYGLEAREVPLAEVDALCGGLLSKDPSRFVGAISLPGDGAIDASNVCALLSAAARRAEATVVEGVGVLEVAPRAGGEEGFDVRTDQGDVLASKVVNCTGQWARMLGQGTGVSIPLHSCDTSTPTAGPGASTWAPASRWCGTPTAGSTSGPGAGGCWRAPSSRTRRCASRAGACRTSSSSPSSRTIGIISCRSWKTPARLSPRSRTHRWTS